MNSSGWLSLTVRLVLAVAVGLLAGSVLSSPLAGVVTVLALYLLSQFLNLFRMLRWLQSDQIALAPDLTGPWGDLVAMVAQTTT